VVIFPDDYEPAEVVKGVAQWRMSRPALQIVFVTSTPQRFKSALEPDGRSKLPVVLAKPAFGWTILDAIRGYARRVPPA
jgi:hypothetical protein